MILLILLVTFISHANPLKSIRLGCHSNKVRIVLDTTKKFPISYALNATKKELRILIKKAKVNSLPRMKGFFKKASTHTLSKTAQQLIFTSTCPIHIQWTGYIPPSKKVKRGRYVIDIVRTKSPPSIQRKRATPKKHIIIIDPGHGGQDPGTIGRNKTQEKNVTLLMARELQKIINKSSKYKAHLTRGGDYYVSLPKRREIARKYAGDLFISLHADSHPNACTQGLSIYTLSRTASDKQAALLAKKENEADRILGIHSHDEPPEVASILMDLAKRETMNLSAQFAHTLVHNLGKRVKLLRNTHRFANFAVLRSLEIPSTLIELGYLSNKHEEYKLRQPHYRKKIALSIAQAVDTFFDQHRS